MKVKRKIIKIDEELCTGCGECVIACAEGAIAIIDGKAKVISDNLCDGLGACLGECPEGALEIIEREADEFDETAVEVHLEAQKKNEEDAPKMACGCSSTHIQSFAPQSPCQKANQPAAIESGKSELRHWPVQIKLVPATAPFLKGAELLVAADCVPVAYPSFHTDFLKGKAIMMGCPKFDGAEEYIQKFTDVFTTADIKKITCAIMEVPCCSGMKTIILKALEKSGKNIPVEFVTIGAQGGIK
ncbi:MAG: 4Fe-4S binding protein [Proteobacteria bacterium]|nr:4Fe-4S binding protein [Pseudomonadota bacterium]